MKRENMKTILGLLVIGIIVVATFLYGNSQRKAQLKVETDIKASQTAKVSPSATVASATPGGASTTTNNTAPVASPQSNTIQGGATAVTGGSGSAATPTATPAPTPSSTPQPAVAAATTIPDTGASIPGLAGMSFMLMAAAYWQWSKRTLGATIRTPRN